MFRHNNGGEDHETPGKQRMIKILRY